MKNPIFEMINADHEFKKGVILYFNKNWPDNDQPEHFQKCVFYDWIEQYKKAFIVLENGQLRSVPIYALYIILEP